MQVSEMIGLSAAAAAAGMINAVAGGGTLITFPTLLLYGTSPIVANATSTVALLVGTAGSLFGYRKQLLAVKSWLRWFAPASLLGGFLGGLLLTRTSDSTFAQLVPYLILFATLLFMCQGAFKRLVHFQSAPGGAAERPKPSPALWGAVLFQFVVALYGGYFGAGIGILMLASLGFIGLTNIHEMNGLKTILGSLINGVAALYFVAAGLVHWPKMAVMTVGALAGYFAGSHFAQRIPPAHVRQLITIIGLTISVYMFYRQWGQ